MRQYASLLFPAPDFIRLLMNLNVPKTGFRHMSGFVTRREGGGGVLGRYRVPIPPARPHWGQFDGHTEGDGQAP